MKSSKRWNGNIDALSIEYLKGVVAKMTDYGDRVQLSLVSGGSQPCYQVVNQLGKKMAFDSNHHLLRPQEDEFTGANVSSVFTLEQVRSAVEYRGKGARSAAAPIRAARGTTSAPRTSAAKVDEEFAAQRYAYFKEHRASLPSTISEHSDEIISLMKKGIPAEDAFGAVVKKYY